MREPTAFVMFSGCGGKSLGLLRAGFRLVGAVDVDELACVDHGILTGERATCADIRSLSPSGLVDMSGGDTPDVLAITAPCQSFAACLPNSKREFEEYVELNDLSYRGLMLALEAWKRSPPIILFENVPRMASYGRVWLDLIKKTLQRYGYSVDERMYDLGEIGGLAQHRRRVLLIARHMEQVPAFIWQPERLRVRGVGEVLGELPVPLPPVSKAWLEVNGGPMHRLTKLSPLNWLRLWAIPPGKDWKALPKEVALPYRKQRQNGPCGVIPWGEPAHTVVAHAEMKSAWASVADPRLKCTPHAGAYGVVHWDHPSKTVLGHHCHDNTFGTVADPRVTMFDGYVEHEMDISENGRPCYLVLLCKDGFWKRPFTNLELAALQGLPTIIDGKWLRLSGTKAHQRKVIGNAVPVQAAEAIGRACIAALNEARAGTWSLNSGAIWVREEALAA